MLIKMYQNPYVPGFEVFSNTASYLVTNDFPDYAAMFYSPTEHEVFSQIKYGNFEQDYSNLREIQQSLNGPPLEFYIPHSFVADEGAGRQDKIQVVSEKIKDKLIETMQKEAKKEIENAQRQVKGKRVKIEVEDV